MTEADDRQDGIERAPADDEAGLWADVRSWTDAILAVVGDLKELATVGLTRSLAVKLCNWLWGMEGAIRRLILAEALKLDASTLAGSRPGTRADASEARRPARRRPSFRIFGFSRQGEAGTGQLSAEDGAAKANLPERWHIRFPADPLLSIGGRSIRGGKAASSAGSTPSTAAAASRASIPTTARTSTRPNISGACWACPRAGPTRPSHPPSNPLPVQEKAGYLRSDLSDWRRLEEEWKRIIPAPHLAARIFAVARILERRDSAIDRIARLVNISRERLVDLLGQPAPQLVWPRHARSIYRCREVEALVPRSQSLLWRLDTS